MIRWLFLLTAIWKWWGFRGVLRYFWLVSTAWLKDVRG